MELFAIASRNHHQMERNVNNHSPMDHGQSAGSLTICSQSLVIRLRRWLPRLDSHQDRRGQNPVCCVLHHEAKVGGAGGSCNLTQPD